MHKQSYQVNRVEIWKNMGKTWFENRKISTCHANSLSIFDKSEDSVDYELLKYKLELLSRCRVEQKLSRTILNRNYPNIELRRTARSWRSREPPRSRGLNWVLDLLADDTGSKSHPDHSLHLPVPNSSPAGFVDSQLFPFHQSHFLAKSRHIRTVSFKSAECFELSWQLSGRPL